MTRRLIMLCGCLMLIAMSVCAQEWSGHKYMSENLADRFAGEALKTNMSEEARKEAAAVLNMLVIKEQLTFVNEREAQMKLITDVKDGAGLKEKMILALLRRRIKKELGEKEMKTYRVEDDRVVLTSKKKEKNGKPHIQVFEVKNHGKTLLLQSEKGTVTFVSE